MDSELSEQVEIEVGMHKGTVLSPLLFVVVVDVVTELATEGVLSELLYGDAIVLMSETIEGNRNKSIKWKEDDKRKGLKDNLVKINEMIRGGITKDGLTKSKVDPLVNLPIFIVHRYQEA